MTLENDTGYFNMYTLMDAFEDELNLQQEYINAYNNMKDKDDAAQKELWQNIEKSIHYQLGIALLRIQQRLENGMEYYMVDGDDHRRHPKVEKNKTNRHLEDKYEELAAAKAEYERILAGCHVLEKLSK